MRRPIQYFTCIDCQTRWEIGEQSHNAGYCWRCDDARNLEISAPKVQRIAPSYARVGAGGKVSNRGRIGKPESMREL
jgi:hypothetical protein